MKRLFILLGIALCALCAHATPVTIRPGLTLEQGNGVYYIHYQVPDYAIMTDTILVESNCCDPLDILSFAAGEYYFNRVEIFNEGDFDFLAEKGRPELPFYSLNLLLSGGLTNIEILDIDATTISLQYPYIPVQMQSSNSCVASFDADYYGSYNDSWYWDDYTADTIRYRFVSGLVFSLFPFHYEPSEQKLTIVTSMDFAIHYDGITIDNDYLDNVLSEDYSARYYFDNFKDYLTTNPVIHDNYLIVVGDHWENETALADFVAHKENLGYNVTVTAMHEIGYTPDAIRAYIKEQFETYNIKFVLLVGDVDEIPFYDGIEEDSTDPPSDIYYACLSKNSISQQYLDFSPSVFLGRWPIQTSTQLRNVVDKTIASDLHLGESNPEQYAINIFSGTGSHQNYLYNDSKYLYDKVVQDYHYAGSLIDGRTFQNQSSAYNSMKTYLEGYIYQTWMFVYRGHGCNFAIGDPYDLYSYQIDYIQTNTLDFQPFGFGFACLLGNIFSSSNFARKWITSEQGGVTFLGATTVSYASCNRYFSRKMFHQLKDKPNMTIGEFIGNAKAKYYNCDKVVWRRRQAKKYVLYGDPSLYLFGIDIIHNVPWDVRSHHQNPNKEDILMEGIENVNSIQIYSITGQLIRSWDNKELNLQELSAGTYMVVIHTDDTVLTKKVAIH